jgi:hypothetical protein
MPSPGRGCDVRLASDLSPRSLIIENPFLQAVVLPDKGGDIHRLIYKPQEIDVLWKTPWGLKRPGSGVPSTYQSVGAWMEAYPGGWQEIFPNGGGPCTYKGAELGFHGEASMTTWDYKFTAPPPDADAAELHLRTRLARSPFRIERLLRVEADKPVLTIRQRITNEGDEPMDYMWGHHPAYGEPFLSGDCRIDINARTLLSDDEHDPPFNPLALNTKYAWPRVERDGKQTDLSRVPPRGEPRALYGYFQDFEPGGASWYAITNQKLGFGVGMIWPTEVFPYAWFWQELSASSGYPWYRAAHTMAIEPFTSYPGQGLLKVMEKTRTQKVLKPAENVEVELKFVFFDSTTGVQQINAEGSVVQRA